MKGVARLNICCFLLWGSISLAQDRQPYIINGIETNQFPAVGIVGEATVGGFCTGTLISPTHVLTAAHCAEAILSVGSGDSGTFEVSGQVYRTIAVEIHPDYNSAQFTHDVAVLILEEPVLDVEPMQLSLLPPEEGELVTLIGFGGQGTPEEGSDGSFGVKLVGEVAVDVVDDLEFFWVFDETSESNPAPGDSGGPVLVDTGEEFLIAGIVSSGTTADAELGDTSFNMRVDPDGYGTWVADTVLASQVFPEEDGETPDDPLPGDTSPGDAAASDPAAETDVQECPLPPPPACPGAGESGEAGSAPATEPGASAPPDEGVAEETTGESDSQVESDDSVTCGNRRRGNPRRRPGRPRGSYRDASRYWSNSSANRQFGTQRRNVRR